MLEFLRFNSSTIFHSDYQINFFDFLEKIKILDNFKLLDLVAFINGENKYISVKELNSKYLENFSQIKFKFLYESEIFEVIFFKNDFFVFFNNDEIINKIIDNIF